MAKRLCKYCFFAILLFSAVLKIPAQAGWELRHVEGDIVFTRNGNRTILRSGSPEIQDVLLGAQDMVQTGRGTAELQLSADSAMTLKLGENTSVLVGNLNEISLELLYGRIRVIGDSQLTVRTGTSTVLLRKFDASLDYIIRPGIPQPFLIVHCFEGEGELTAASLSDSEEVRLPLRKNESLSLEYQIPFIYVERKNLETAVLDYWKINPISSSVAPDLTTTNLSAGTEESGTGLSTGTDDSGTELSTNQEPVRQELPPVHTISGNIKNAYIITGLALIGAGALMQGYSYLGNPGPELRDNLFYSGYGPFGLGAVFLLSAAIFNPRAGSAKR